MSKKVKNKCPNCEKPISPRSLIPIVSKGEIAYYKCPHCGAQLEVEELRKEED